MTKTFQRTFFGFYRSWVKFFRDLFGQTFFSSPAKEHAYMAGSTMQAGKYDHGEMMYAF